MEKKLFARYPIGNPNRKWKQDHFVMSVSNPGVSGLEKENELHLEKTRRGVETAVEAGFNLLEPLWASPAVGMEIVRTAERLGAKVLYQNLRRFGGMGFSKKHLNDGQDLEGVIRDMACWNCIEGYYVYDEPINTEQRKITKDLIEVVEKQCPEMLPFTVSPVNENNIDKLADEVDPAQLSFDIYPFGNVGRPVTKEIQLDQNTIWYYFEQAKRASDRIHAPFWFYYQGHALNYKSNYDHYHFNASRMMANAALLYGAKGLSAYVELNGYVDSENGGHGPYFEEQKKLNEETLKLGNTLMALTCERVIHDSQLVLDKEDWDNMRHCVEESKWLAQELPRRVSVGELSDEYGHQYLMVLNRDYTQENRFRLKLKNPARIYRISEKDGLERLVYEGDTMIPFLIAPGGVHLYRIQPMEEEPYLMEYYLEKQK